MFEPICFGTTVWDLAIRPVRPHSSYSIWRCRPTSRRTDRTCRLLTIFVLLACNFPSATFAQVPTTGTAEKRSMTIQRSSFGQTHDGTPVDLFTLTNSSGNTVQLTNYGAILVSVRVPDRTGQRANVTLGYPELDSYLAGHPYFGSTVGRFCNRIAGGEFSLDGEHYTLVINNGPNHLHGGTIGFDKQVWKAETMEGESSVGVRFSLLSPAGQEGYPGNLKVIAEYTWNNANELTYVFRATTDRSTVLNLTNHAYWNLAGAGHGNVLEHELTLQCDQSLAVDDTLIPTGQYLSVADTPLDFRSAHKLGERIEQLPATKGYDHCYVVNGKAGGLRTCAKITDPSSGRTMEILTTQPGVQLYTANHMGPPFGAHGAFCLETQHYPDSPNHPEFPTTRLNPSEEFQETTLHRFTVQ